MASQNRGIIKTAQGKAVLASIPVPKLRDDYILVKTVAVALNPTDWQTTDETFGPDQTPMLLGCDSAGIVVEVGKNVTRNFKPGDRIASMAHGGAYLCFENPIKDRLADMPMLKGMYCSPKMVLLPSTLWLRAIQPYTFLQVQALKRQVL